MRVLVTGAAGFVGLNVVVALLEAGHSPVGFVRRSTKTEHLLALNVPLRTGDLEDFPSLLTALQGVDAVIHCAANTSGFRVDRAMQRRANVLGTAHLIDACLRQGIKRLIFTSTTSTIGSVPSPGRADERVALNGFRAKSQYGVTKREAEILVLEANDKGLETVVLNPAEVMGSYDYHFGWGSVLVGLKNGSLPFVPRGAGSFCHAREVGRAHVAALTLGKPGERYILAGTDVSYSVLFKKVAAAVGATLPKPNVVMDSPACLRAIFAVMEAAYPFTRKLPPLDQNRIRVFSTELYFDTQKACSELGFQVRPIDDMIDDCHAWYQSQRIL